MIEFYPRDVGMWRKTFDFDMRKPRPSKQFQTMGDLKEFLKLHKVRFDDDSYPFTIGKYEFNYGFNKEVKSVHQWTVIGWLVDDEQQ